MRRTAATTVEFADHGKPVAGGSNKIPDALKGKLKSDFDPDSDEVRAKDLVRRYYGLYYEETAKDYSFGQSALLL